MQQYESIIAGCKKKDRKSQQRLFELLASKMYGHCLRYTKNEVDAQDVLQEGFIKVFDKINTLQNPSVLESWMSRIFINEALGRWRKKKAGPDFVDVEAVDAQADSTDETDGSVSELEVNDVLELIKQLPDNQQAVLNMYAIDGLSHNEICEMLDISLTNSKTLLRRARIKLKELISQRTK